MTILKAKDGPDGDYAVFVADVDLMDDEEPDWMHIEYVLGARR